jgi:hypothetical protein
MNDIDFFAADHLILRSNYHDDDWDCGPDEDSSTKLQVAGRPKALDPNGTAHWYSETTPVAVHGYHLMMVYVGTRLLASSGFDVEPCLIDPTLRVYSAPQSYVGHELTYYPQYAELSPYARGAYLKWLSTGRQDPKAPIGFVFLFYYGLERRLLSGECRTHERCDLIAEIERLRTVYGGHSSFSDYSMRLLDFLAAEEYEISCLIPHDMSHPPLSARGSNLIARD